MKKLCLPRLDRQPKVDYVCQMTEIANRGVIRGALEVMYKYEVAVICLGNVLGD